MVFYWLNLYVNIIAVLLNDFFTAWMFDGLKPLFFAASPDNLGLLIIGTGVVVGRRGQLTVNVFYCNEF